MLILEMDVAGSVNPTSYYIAAAADGDKAVLQPGHSVQEPLARVLLLCLPPRQLALSPDAFDV